MIKTECNFCGAECNNQYDMNIESDYNDCDYCGLYAIHLSPFDHRLLKKKHIVAGYLNETKDEPFRKEIIQITKEKYNEILEDELIPETPMQKLDKLLMYCYKKNNAMDKEFTIILPNLKKSLNKKRIYINGNSQRIGIAYTRSQEELNSVLKAVLEEGWINPTLTSENDIEGFSINTNGKKRISKIIEGNKDNSPEEPVSKTRCSLEKLGEMARAIISILAVIILFLSILYIVFSAFGVNLPTELEEIFRGIINLK